MSEKELVFLDWLQKIKNPELDLIMKGISGLGDRAQLWVIIALVLLSRKKKKGFWCGVHILAALLITMLIVNVGLKPLVGRVRPFVAHPDFGLLIATPKDASFPSGHTASSFAAAVAIYMHDKKRGKLALIFACFMGISRMYLYVHFPSDIVAGGICGVLSALLGKGALKHIKIKLENKSFR